MKEESQKTKEIKPETMKREGKPIIDIFHNSDKITCPDLENKFLLVRVGTNDRPAKDIDIKEVQEKLEKMLKDNNVNCLTFVTHHAVSIDILEKKGI